MDLNKVYYDEEGNAKHILQMVKLYPEWAANMLQEGEKAIESAMSSNAVLADVISEIEELEDWKDVRDLKFMAKEIKKYHFS